MNKAILIMGPTASGKTNIAIQLAKIYPIEIISVDSALIYSDMNIGTAKPSIDDLRLVPHHLIDIVNPLKSYSVADFVRDSINIANDITTRCKIPVFVGGTMMYFNALINGLSELPVSNMVVRGHIEEFINNAGLDKAYAKLTLVDPVIAAKIKSADSQRIIRALEIHELTGIPMSTLQQQLKPRIKHDFHFLAFRIIPNERNILHTRIKSRFIKMLEEKFIEEVKSIRVKYPDLTINHTSMRSVGYKQAWQYLDGDMTYENFIESGVAATRQLAKRQLTWLRNMDFNKLNQLLDIVNLIDTEMLEIVVNAMAKVQFKN